MTTGFLFTSVSPNRQRQNHLGPPKAKARTQGSGQECPLHTGAAIWRGDFCVSSNQAKIS
jgi:hypothetical protein